MDTYSIIVIGAGSGGLVIAIGAAKAGKTVLLLEKGPYGGDCTNYGCIPSKSLIASAHAAYAIGSSEKYGITLSSHEFNSDGVLKRVAKIVHSVRSHEEPEILKELGVSTLTGHVRFVAPHLLEVLLSDGSSRTVEGKQIVIATGSVPIIPLIPGLENTPYLTNETIFDLEKIPKRLAVMGGGPIGCELAQAFQRLGAKVQLIHKHPHLLAKEEPEAQHIIAAHFEKEGMQLHLNTTPQEISYEEGTFVISLDTGRLEVDSLLIAVGHRPHLESLNLAASGITYSEKGIPTDRYGRTTQKHIWVVGDAKGPPFFTHFAENQARSVLTSLLLPLGFCKKLDLAQALPRTTFTDPEIASVGLTQKQALEHYRASQLAIYRVHFSEVDRAITDGREEGFVQIITKKWSSKILGATIVGPRAGEMISEISLAMYEKTPLRKLRKLIHPFPTYSLAIRKAADLWLTQTLLSLFRKKI
jgi:pyruvate/2-oxoglutarate dehydrogenase complex dihydrolipoamide dehydrogenase (E3) component